MSFRTFSFASLFSLSFKEKVSFRLEYNLTKLLTIKCVTEIVTVNVTRTAFMLEHTLVILITSPLYCFVRRWFSYCKIYLDYFFPSHYHHSCKMFVV